MEIQFFVKDIHCRQVLTYLSLLKEWQTFCRHAIIFYRKTEFLFLGFPYFRVMPIWSGCRDHLCVKRSVRVLYVLRNVDHGLDRCPCCHSLAHGTGGKRLMLTKPSKKIWDELNFELSVQNIRIARRKLRCRLKTVWFKRVRIKREMPETVLRYLCLTNIISYNQKTVHNKLEKSKSVCK